MQHNPALDITDNPGLELNCYYDATSVNDDMMSDDDVKKQTQASIDHNLKQCNPDSENPLPPPGSDQVCTKYSHAAP